MVNGDLKHYAVQTVQDVGWRLCNTLQVVLYGNWILRLLSAIPRIWCLLMFLVFEETIFLGVF